MLTTKVVLWEDIPPSLGSDGAALPRLDWSEGATLDSRPTSEPTPVEARLTSLVDGLPNGAFVTLPVDRVRDWLRKSESHRSTSSRSRQNAQNANENRVRRDELPWRERLWMAPPETRLGTIELSQALGRPKSWIYSRTQAAADNPIPHRKLDGSLVFTVGEVRAWIRETEDVVIPGKVEPTHALESENGR